MTTAILEFDLSTTSALTWRSLPSSRADEALAAWRTLEQQVKEVPVACCAAWTDCWLRSYGDVVPARFLIAELDGAPRGICLLTDAASQKLGPFSIRTRHLGTAGEPQPGSVCVEYNTVLADPALRDEFIAGVAKSIHLDPTWEQFRLDGVAEEDLQPWLAHFPGAAIQRRESKYFDLRSARDSGGDVLARLGKSTRSNVRRRLKQYDNLDCEWAASVEQAADIFHELVQLHQARWQAVGQLGAFAANRFHRFQQDVCVRLFLEQRVVLFRVRHQGETVGCLMLLVDRNRLLDYLSGFASFEAKPSPGLITHYLCMSEALRRAYDAYDFLVGDKRHKDNLSTHVNRLGWLTWSRPTLKLRAIEALRTMKRFFQRTSQKQSSPST